MHLFPNVRYKVIHLDYTTVEINNDRDNSFKSLNEDTSNLVQFNEALHCDDFFDEKIQPEKKQKIDLEYDNIEY